MSITKIQDKINTEVLNSNEAYEVLDAMIKDIELSNEDHYMLIIKLMKEKIDELVDEVNSLKQSK
tara:strand:+ start:1043 stop:1237 length:195 start_codon:yes stop_codon:yes gene_type:complete